MLDAQPAGEATREDLKIDTVGGTLAAVLYRPEGAPRAALVLNGATGVPQAYYAHFARWLAQEQNIACLTFDYRDFGASAVGPMRASRVRMSDWALHDQPAARRVLRARFPDVPLWVLGHSLGGMLMPSQDGIEEIDRMICVASGLVHHVQHPWPYQALARLFWFGHAPVLVRALGYLPGRLTGFGEDLPAPVYWEWRRWCTTADSYLPETQGSGGRLPRPDWGRSAAGKGAPVELLSLADDPVIPPACVARLEPVYAGGVVRGRVLDPAQFGLKQVGHLGAFARRNRAIWPALIAGPEPDSV